MKVKSAVGNQNWCNGNIGVLHMIVEIGVTMLAVVTLTTSSSKQWGWFRANYVNKVANNLLSNAFKFTPEYGKISVLVWSKNQRLFVDVQDTGEGMDKETLKHIFEPFYRLIAMQGTSIQV